MASAALPLQPVDLGPVIASRRLWRRRLPLQQIEPTLTTLIEGRQPTIDPLPDDAAGYRFQSCPRAFIDSLSQRLPGMAAGRRQDFPRHYIDMTTGFDAYLARFSGKTRSTLRRKTRKLVSENGGTLEVRSFHRAEESKAFFSDALPLSARTYQDRLLDAGLPGDALFRAETERLAGQDALRAWVLYLAGRPAAYLYLPVIGDTVRYDFLGYDPARASLSPGTVLQMHALDELMAEDRFRWFDFTSGDGAHKRLFATGSVDCSTLVMLRGEWRNRLTLAAGDAIDAAVDRAGHLADRWGIKAKLKGLLRR